MEYDNTNRGVLFKNDRKEKDTHADMQGTINVEGKEFYLNAWTKQGKSGKFLSLSVKPKPASVKEGMAQAKPAPAWEDDGIPF